jgi:hypothetical protein
MTVAPMPISAQIIHEGKYDPRMFRDGAELHPVSTRTQEPVRAYKQSSARVLAQTPAVLAL